MVFKRKVYNEMLEWKKFSAGKTALLLEGARRIGKSTVVEEFVKMEYDDYLILDFAKENKDVKNLFEYELDDIDELYRKLMFLKNKSFKNGRTAIVFDEVQMCPKARQAIKYLVADGRYDYIETGSLISIKKITKDILIPSEEYRIHMYPMDFEEFLWALDESHIIPIIQSAFEKRKPLGDSIHRAIMNKFRLYMAIGGMPQAVLSYVEKDSYKQIDMVKRSILELYEDDLKKSDDEFSLRASSVFKTVPQQLMNHNSMFRFSKVDKTARYQNYIETMEFINESMICNLCYNVTTPEVAMELYAERNRFKLYMGDTGLLITQIMKNNRSTNNDLYKALIFDKLDVNMGMVMENMVAQMLRASGHELYFHEYRYTPEEQEKEKQYEIDFMLVKEQKICPIEVKSSGYKNHKSFDYLTKKYQMKCQDKYIFYTKDLKYLDGILFLPVYMAGLV